MSGAESAGHEGSATGGKGTPVPVHTPEVPKFRTNLMLLLAGPLIWTAHFMIVYLVTEAGCNGGGRGLTLFSPPIPTLVTLALTGIGAFASLLSARLSYRRWRGSQGKEADKLDPTGANALAFVGYLLSLLAFVVILFVGLPALVIPACLG